MSLYAKLLQEVPYECSPSLSHLKKTGSLPPVKQAIPPPVSPLREEGEYILHWLSTLSIALLEGAQMHPDNVKTCKE